MNDKKHLLKCTKEILALAENVYHELGSGYKEEIYQKALAIHFRKKNIFAAARMRFIFVTRCAGNKALFFFGLKAPECPLTKMIWRKIETKK